MTSYQEDRFDTLLKVDLFFSRNAAALSINPIFADVDAELDALRSEIFANDVMAIRDLTGFTVVKAEKRKELEDKFFLVCSGLRGHFAGTGEKQKAEQIDHSKSHIITSSEDLLNSEAELAWMFANPIKTLLVPNQVTDTDVDALQTLRQDFLAMRHINRAEEGAGKAAREKMVVLFETGFNTILIRLDELMMPFASTNPGLYSEYQTARAIDDSGGNSGSEGFDVQTVTVPGNGTVTFPIGGPPAPDDEFYIRAIDGSPTPVAACTPGAGTFLAQRGETFKGLVSGLGIDLNQPYVNVTNPSPDAVIVRVGTKI